MDDTTTLPVEEIKKEIKILGYEHLNNSNSVDIIAKVSGDFFASIYQQVEDETFKNEAHMYLYSRITIWCSIIICIILLMLCSMICFQIPVLFLKSFVIVIFLLFVACLLILAIDVKRQLSWYNKIRTILKNKRLYALLAILFTISNIFAQTVIEMEYDGGVYKIPCSVNGARMKMIFDTGASMVSISEIMAKYLYENDYLKQEDIVGTGKSEVADGRIVDHVKINIRDLEISGLHLRDIQAMVSSGQNAPLLLGQTAIQKLGNISISGNKLIINDFNLKERYKEAFELIKKIDKYYQNDNYYAALECLRKLDYIGQLDGDAIASLIKGRRYNVYKLYTDKIDNKITKEEFYQRMADNKERRVIYDKLVETYSIEYMGGLCSFSEKLGYYEKNCHIYYLGPGGYLYKYVECLYMTNHYKDCIAQSKKWIQKYTSYFDKRKDQFTYPYNVYFWLGFSYASEKKYEEAITNLEIATNYITEPYRVDVYSAIACCYSCMDKLQLAISYRIRSFECNIANETFWIKEANEGKRIDRAYDFYLYAIDLGTIGRYKDRDILMAVAARNGLEEAKAYCSENHINYYSNEYDLKAFPK